MPVDSRPCADDAGRPVVVWRALRMKRVHGVLIGASAVLVVGAVVVGVNLTQLGATTPTPLPSVGPQGVAGLLFQDRNGDGVRNDGEHVLPGWSVRLYGTGPLALQTTVTADDGTFSFPQVENLAADVTSVDLRFEPVLEGPAADNLPSPSALSQSVTRSLGSSEAVAVESFRACVDLEGCPELELPNLVPILTSSGGEDYPPPTETRLDVTTNPGHVLLRFATSTANVGGLLHVVGGPTEGDTQEIRQFVYGPDVVLDQRAGSFVYHPEHHHVHVADFVRYELVDASGAVVASSAKVSFCLTDIQTIETSSALKQALFLDLPPLECGATEQGINPGHADYYGPQLPDQWIDVTGIPAGDYRLRFTVNPDRALLESRYDDNSVEFPVTLSEPENG